MKTINVSLAIPAYSDTLKLNWTDGFDIRTTIEQGSIKITMNKEGLVSLANHLLNLAQNDVPVGHHLHLDEHNALSEGSIDLLIEKIV